VATFQLKDFASITASMVNLMQSTQFKITDFNIGSIVRTMLESCAAEIDELYQQMFNGIQQAIPVSVYNSFSFPALVALPASGLVTVIITSQTTPTLIASGTVFTPAGSTNTYATAADVTIAIGQTTVSVPVTSVTSGSASNLGAGVSFTLSPAPTGFVSATNPNAWINGTDDESPADQLIRFNGYISTLQRSTNPAIQYGAQTTKIFDASGNLIERVASALVVEPYLTNNALPISSIFCYIHNGVGSTSVGLVSQAQNVINGYTDTSGTPVPGWKAAGVVCTVAAATEQPRSLTAVLTAAAGYSHATLVTQAVSVLTAYMLAIPIGAPAIFAIFEALVMAIPGVANFAISVPNNTDTAATAANYKIMPGTITIT